MTNQQIWREKAEGTLEDIDLLAKHRKNHRLKLRDWFRLFYAIGAAIISISNSMEREAHKR
jgi:hypothetical protein